MRTGVRDRPSPDPDPSGCGFDCRLRRHHAGFQRGGDREGLDRRAGLERVAHRAVAHALRLHPVAPGRVEAGPVGQRQDLAAGHVEHDDRSSLGLVGLDRRSQCRESDVLDPVVDRQLDVAPFDRLAHPVVFDGPPQPVLDQPAQTVPAGQRALECELDAVLTAILDVGKSQQLGSDRSLGIQATELAAGVDSGQVERFDPLGDVRFDLAFQVDETAVVGSQAPAQLGGRHLQQPRELRQIPLARGDVVRNGPDPAGRNGGGEHHSVAIGNRAAGGRHVQRACIARFALALQELSRQAPLQVEDPASQSDESAEQCEQQHARAPGRQPNRQQGIGRPRVGCGATFARAPAARLRAQRAWTGRFPHGRPARAAGGSNVVCSGSIGRMPS